MNKICVLEGNIVDRKGVLEKIKNSLADNYELFVFDKQDTYEYVSQMITELSCFGERRIFIIKELPKIDAPTEVQARTKVLNRFKKLFKIIPEGNILVFDNVGISAESFFKEVRKYGKIYKFAQKINKSDARKLIDVYFQKRKMKLNGDILGLIADSLNVDGDEVDVDKLSLVIKKFHNYVCGKKNVNKEDVYKVCSSSKEFVIWSLYNLLDEQSLLNDSNKDVSLIMKLINGYFENVKYFQHEAVMLIRSIIWRYGVLLLFKNGVNNRISQKEIINQILNIKKLESKGRAYKIKLTTKLKDDKSIPEYSFKMINSIIERRGGRVSLACYSFDKLILIYYILIKTLIKIRSGCTDAEVKIVILINILTICGIIKKKNTLDGILSYKKMLYGIENA